MNLPENEYSVPEAALQRDIGIANRAKKRIAMWGAIALASVGLFVAREVKNDWNVKNIGFDLEQVADIYVAGFVSGAMYGGYEIYSDAKGRITYRQEMIERSQNIED